MRAQTERLTCHTRLLNIDEMRLEHAFWGFKPLRTDLDHSAIRQLQSGAKTEMSLACWRLLSKGVCNAGLTV